MEDPSKDVLGPSGWTDKKKNSRGVTLWRFFWPAQKPLGVAVIVHGHGSHLIYDFLAVKIFSLSPLKNLPARS